MYSDIPILPYTKFAEDAECIKNSIDMCLYFSPGSRLNHPTFGCELDSVLFDPIDDHTARKILLELLQCLQRWDPRFRVVPGLSSVVPDVDNNRYDVKLLIEVVLPSEQNIEYEYFSTLERPIN